MNRRGIHSTALIGDAPQHRDHYWTNPGVPPEIDPTATVGAYSSVDAGIERATAIGPRSWVMKHVHVGHDVVIGADVIICPMSSIGGHVEIGDGARIDMGVTVKPFVKIGAGARCGMGAVVTKDVPAGEVWVGNPARNIDERNVASWDDRRTQLLNGVSW
jgi:acyl-[acyl carrier protein]--UDP-N-acetylglucosamine O-acyltransferase